MTDHDARLALSPRARDALSMQYYFAGTDAVHRVRFLRATVPSGTATWCGLPLTRDAVVAGGRGGVDGGRKLPDCPECGRELDEATAEVEKALEEIDQSSSPAP